MHEVGIILSIIDSVDEICIQNNYPEVVSITLEVGELASVVPSYLKESYECIVKDTMFENTKLIIENVPAIAKCSDCGKEYNVIECGKSCPDCDSPYREFLSGLDLNIKEIEIYSE